MMAMLGMTSILTTAERLIAFAGIFFVLFILLLAFIAFVFFKCAKQNILFHAILLITLIVLAIFGISHWLVTILALIILLPVLLTIPKLLRTKNEI